MGMSVSLANHEPETHIKEERRANGGEDVETLAWGKLVTLIVLGMFLVVSWDSESKAMIGSRDHKQVSEERVWGK